jgi:hypothetical protein
MSLGMFCSQALYNFRGEFREIPLNPLKCGGQCRARTCDLLLVRTMGFNGYSLGIVGSLLSRA